MKRNDVLEEVIQMILKSTKDSYYRMPVASTGKKLIEEIERMKDAADSVCSESQPGDGITSVG